MKNLLVFRSDIKTKSFVNGIANSSGTSLKSKAVCGHHFPCSLIVWNHTKQSSFSLIMAIIFVPCGS